MFLSLYEHYPIYEPAEGGYYYTGMKLRKTKYVPFFLVRKALKKIHFQWTMEAEGYMDGDRVYLYRDGVQWLCKYIGDGQSVIVERLWSIGSHEKGRVPYA